MAMVGAYRRAAFHAVILRSYSAYSLFELMMISFMYFTSKNALPYTYFYVNQAPMTNYICILPK